MGRVSHLDRWTIFDLVERPVLDKNRRGLRKLHSHVCVGIVSQWHGPQKWYKHLPTEIHTPNVNQLQLRLHDLSTVGIIFGLVLRQFVGRIAAADAC